MFVIKHNFKIGDLVKVISKENGLDKIFDKICEITDYQGESHDGTPRYFVSCPGYPGVWIVYEDQIEPAIQNYEPSDRITDSNTNYKELFKEPIYIEFINVGEAFDKLKMYEDREYSTSVGLPEDINKCTPAPDTSEIKVGDVVFIIGTYLGNKSIKCALVKEVASGRVEVQYPSGKTFSHARGYVFKDYNQALKHL